MSERNAPRIYGVGVGLVSGLFAIMQVALSVAAARGAEAPLRAIQQAFAILAAGSIADPTTLIPALIPMLLTTYLSMLGIGALTVWFAWRAGRLAAMAQGLRAGGASAGMWVWLTSTLMWLLASVAAIVITHSDGTISGVFFGTFSDQYLPQQLIFLLFQEVIAALIGLGFCALAGANGARNAPVFAPEAARMPAPGSMGYLPQGAYPYTPYGLPGYPVYPPRPGQQPYPGYPGYPPSGWGAAPGAPYPGGVMAPPLAPHAPPSPQFTAPQAAAPMPYPPPPSFYVPQQPASAQAEPSVAPPATEPAPQAE